MEQLIYSTNITYHCAAIRVEINKVKLILKFRIQILRTIAASKRLMF